ncbi:MAG: DsrE family protein [Saccharofermentans sp.]|nr:DsrE family protein [Saccharofermentans sp.]
MKPEKDDIGYFKPEVAEFEDTELDLEPSFLDINRSENLIVLFKHDYYSTDTIHGRYLISKFIKSLINNPSKIDKLFFIDTSIRLLSEDSELADQIKELVSHAGSTYVCTESLQAYEITINDGLSFNQALASDIAAELIAADRVFTIE